MNPIARRSAAVLLVLALTILGYSSFGIVVALYLGIWIYGDKMALAQGPVVHVIGGVSAHCSESALRCCSRAGCYPNQR
jgi:hypothetical protein